MSFWAIRRFLDDKKTNVDKKEKGTRRYKTCC